MKNRLVILGVTTLALSFLLVGCNREISKSKSSSVSRDGTIKSTEKTVTETPAGTVIKTEESKTTSPRKP
jgi:hypothetical protein